MEHQDYLFPPDQIFSIPPPAALASVAPPLTAEIAALWGLPLDQRVQITLRDHALASALGRLELTRLPDLPLDAHTPLALRIGKDEFSSRQIIAWSLAD
jgi:hypothetical protein